MSPHQDWLKVNCFIFSLLIPRCYLCNLLGIANRPILGCCYYYLLPLSFVIIAYHCYFCCCPPWMPMWNRGKVILPITVSTAVMRELKRFGLEEPMGTFWWLNHLLCSCLLLFIDIKITLNLYCHTFITIYKWSQGESDGLFFFGSAVHKKPMNFKPRHWRTNLWPLGFLKSESLVSPEITSSR
jgi:hypothetical protein